MCLFPTKKDTISPAFCQGKCCIENKANLRPPFPSGRKYDIMKKKGMTGMAKAFSFTAPLRVEPDGGAYVVCPFDVRREFGRGRVKVHAEFDGVPYDGSVVNMGLKNPDGSVLYVIGVTKAIRRAMGKRSGDIIRVHIAPR